ncbi:MAG: helix-turn-helix transcriptional regulator [Actinobacteria bacterium]|nr:helix-turn-helix transcriptional regulator [Actinomycetota bacterium]
MVRPVEDDARGIVAPDLGLTHFRLERFPPSPSVGRFVDRYWVVTWDRCGQPPYTQHVLAHPVVNISFVDGGPGIVHGPTTRLGSRTLVGAGRALGVMFRPAGFRPMLRRSMSTIVDADVRLGTVLGAAAAGVAAAVARASGPEDMAMVVDGALRSLVPHGRRSSEATTELAEQIAADPACRRVEALAAGQAVSVRQLQRRFADHVGLSPKAVIRRYRLYEAAERARAGPAVDWAALAAELGYSDQAHLTREFTDLLGLSPGRYVAANAGHGPVARER